MLKKTIILDYTSSFPFHPTPFALARELLSQLGFILVFRACWGPGFCSESLPLNTYASISMPMRYIDTSYMGPTFLTST